MISLRRAKKIARKFKSQKILVIGDLMLDRYVIGDVHRISPEAPVPVVLVSEEYGRLGGAANVALNVRSLGARSVVAGIAGKDHEAKELMGLLKKKGISDDGVIMVGGIRTTVKTRILAERQQVVRVDYEEPTEKVEKAVDGIRGRIAGLMKGVSGVVIEDYGKGVITPDLVDSVLETAHRGGIPVGFDPKDNEELRVSGIALATPNFKEACTAAGLPESPLSGEPESDPRLKRAGEILLEKWNPDMLIITLGPHGMYLVSRGTKPRIIPTKAREVFDVSGAGDTVIATAMVAYAAGADFYEAASLANHAAGVVVGKLGTATCSLDELLHSIGENG